VQGSEEHLAALQVGDVVVSPTLNRLEKGDRSTQIEPRVMDVLLALAQADSKVVSRQDLIDRVWGEVAGSDDGLSRAVSVLRSALGSVGDEERYIETIPRRGYRLAVPVSEDIKTQPRQPTGAGSGIDPARQGRRWPGPVLAGSLAILALVIGSLYWLENGAQPGEIPEPAYEASLAVLPFEPFSTEQSDRFFGYGLTEELIHSLSAVPELGVAARTSSFSFGEGGRPRGDIRAIGEALGVSHIVEGSVRREGERVRVTAQLIRASDGLHVWSSVEEHVGEDVFALQDKIVEEVSRAVQLHLDVGYGEGTRPARDIDPRALAYYYEGLHQLGNAMRHDGAADEGYQALRRAVELDPDFAEAWVALATTGVQWASGPLANDKVNFIRQVREDLAQSLRLAPDDHRTHIAHARFHAYVSLDLDKTRRHLAKAEELALLASETLYAQGYYAWLVGRPEEALRYYERALRLDPFNLAARLSVALKLAVLGDGEQAFEFLDECLRTECLAEGFVAYGATAALLAGDEATKDRWADAYAGFQKKLASVPPSAKPHSVRLLPAHFSIGFNNDPGPARDILSELDFASDPITDHIGMWGMTLGHAMSADMFVATLTEAYDRGDLFSTQLSLWPFYGAASLPPEVLKHPAYKDLWSRPELAQLADLRRQNGWPHGLPTTE
jgi:TolB-like protein/DNA-binding winged helix-turn-helix (wHTH) protein/Tfp pilus assembly protein PilF